MTEQDYINKLNKYESSFMKKKRELSVKYALEHRIASIGDVLTSKRANIKVTKYSMNYTDKRVPYLAYIGVILKKDGNPRKDCEKILIYPHEVMTVNGEEVDHGQD